MALSKFDMSNSAMRIFLQDVGKFYDEEKGFFDPFGPKVSQKDELLDFFKHVCCFCSAKINRKAVSRQQQKLGFVTPKNYDPSLNLHLGSIKVFLMHNGAHNEHSFQ